MAAPVLTAGGLGDLIQMTLPAIQRDSYTEIATDLQRHTAMSELMLSSRLSEQSGSKIQWNVMVDHAGTFRNAGINSPDVVNIKDTQVQASADWRYSTYNWTLIEQEIDMNREPARIVDIIKERHIAAKISAAEGMERNFWGPPVAVTDTETPWGVNTWVVKNATEGFNGGAPTGYTTIGLNPTTYPRWKNWTYQYSAVTKDDLVRHIRQACEKTYFMPAVEGIPSTTTGHKWGFYTTLSVRQQLEEILEAQNENLGSDLDPEMSKPILRNSKIQWVPFLDADTTGPFYGLDWGYFKTVVLKGWWEKTVTIPHYPGQHTSAVTFVDFFYQFVSKNRRCHFVAATGTTYPS